MPEFTPPRGKQGEDRTAIHRVPRPPRTWAQWLGTALAAVLVLSGLVVVGVAVFVSVGISHYGDNK